MVVVVEIVVGIVMGVIYMRRCPLLSDGKSNLFPHPHPGDTHPPSTNELT